jgi:hypothetical protein
MGRGKKYRHDHTRAAYAIFPRPPSTFKMGSLGSLMAPANRTLLNDILTLYKVDLIGGNGISRRKEKMGLLRAGPRKLCGSRYLCPPLRLRLADFIVRSFAANS